ncbi:Hypothetical predicted protein [Olea europaea subsp. europaea]|uniref:Uncharacterized protein n=1 Tax=Olea europaea subsp. europaea TaxID=158383 RepID=A0A8S0T350_OLEEU|nr:Hypothetical predicted protein [Olea europaea subsp. europaea]
MDNWIESLESIVSQIPSLEAIVVELKEDLEHLNLKLGKKLRKMNEKLESSLAMGRRELNEGLQTIAQMIKGLLLDSSTLTEEGSGVRSFEPTEKRLELEPITTEKESPASAKLSIMTVSKVLDFSELRNHIGTD